MFGCCCCDCDCSAFDLRRGPHMGFWVLLLFHSPHQNIIITEEEEEEEEEEE